MKLAVALAPAVASGSLKLGRSRAVLWASGKYAKLLGDLGARVEWYETTVKGRRYKRGRVVVDGPTYARLRRVLLNTRRLRSAVRSDWELFFRAWRLFRGHWPKDRAEVKHRLWRLLGRRLVRRLIMWIRGKRGMTRFLVRPTKRVDWRLIGWKNYRGLGFYKLIAGCVENKLLYWEDISRSEAWVKCKEEVREVLWARRPW